MVRLFRWMRIGPGCGFCHWPIDVGGAVQAGTYNTRALVPEVLVRDSEWALVRRRLEVDQLIGFDRLPDWL